MDRLDDCNSCKEHKRVCIYAPVGAQPTQITPIGVTPSPSTSPSSDDWQPSIAARTRSDPSSRAGSQTAVSYHGAPSAITRYGSITHLPSRHLSILLMSCTIVDTSHEAYGHDTGTMPVKRMILPAQCSCNESFRCIEHDPQTPLLAHLMSDEQMMQVGTLFPICISERITLILSARRILSHTSLLTRSSDTLALKGVWCKYAASLICIMF